MSISNQVETTTAQDRYQVTRDGKPVFGPATHDDCWLYLHKGSSGASVDWLCRYEGYAIVPALD